MFYSLKFHRKNMTLRQLIHILFLLVSTLIFIYGIVIKPRYSLLLVPGMMYSILNIFTTKFLSLKIDIIIYLSFLVLLVYLPLYQVSSIAFLLIIFFVPVIFLEDSKETSNIPLFHLLLFLALIPSAISSYRNNGDTLKGLSLFISFFYTVGAQLSLQWKHRNMIEHKEIQIRDIAKTKRIISHDIKNFITPTSYRLQLLKSNIENKSYKEEDIIALTDSVEITLSRINILAKRMSYNSIEEKGEPCNLANKLQVALQEFKPLFQKEKKTLNLLNSFDELNYYTAPEISWNCGIYNVIDNALRFSRSYLNISFLKEGSLFYIHFKNDIKKNTISSDVLHTGLTAVTEAFKNTNLECLYTEASDLYHFTIIVHPLYGTIKIK